MRQMLLTKELRAKFPPLYANEKKDPKDVPVIAKFFTPYAQWTWYATEFDGKETFFGLVVGQETELGYFNLGELEALKGPGGIQGVERDRYFEATLGEVAAKEGVELGGAPAKEEKPKDLAGTNPELERIGKEQIKKTFLAECQAGIPEEEGLGIAIARHYKWDGERIMRLAYAALEDANFHKEAAMLYKLLPEGKEEGAA